MNTVRKFLVIHIRVEVVSKRCVSSIRVKASLGNSLKLIVLTLQYADKPHLFFAD